MGSGTKCNQTGCENPVPGFDDICATCGARYGKHFGYECPDEKGRFVPLRPTDQPDPEAVECEQRLDELTACGIGTEEWIRRRSAIISRYLKKAREEYSERLDRECDALKESTDKLRDQLCANTKLISELQHTVRLVQETHAQHVHKCAVKAFQALEDAKWLDHDRRSATEHKDNIVRIICEAFGAPAKKTGIKDEFEEWYKATGFWPSDYQGKGLIREGFMAAWKLAKADNKGFAGQGPDIDQIKLKLRMDEITKEQWHGKGGK